MTDRIIAGIPLAGVKLSSGTAKAVKAYEDAQKAYVTYTSANRDCATPKAYSPFRGNQSPQPAALVKAEKELQTKDMEAVAKGQSLTNRDEFLAPVLSRIDEYRRTEPLLKKAMEVAENAAVEAVRAELPALARQTMDQATEARKAYSEALEKMKDAEAQFLGRMAHFMQVVTGGTVQRPRYRGIHTTETEKYLHAWEVSESGRLSWDGAWSLGLVGPGSFDVETVDLTPLVDSKEEEMTPWNGRNDETTVWRDK